MDIQRSIAVIAAGLLLSVTGAQLAYAQVGQGLQVKPAIIEDKATPGQTYNFTVTVKNISSEERTLTIVTKDISGLDDNGLPIFAPADQETTYSLSSWIHVPQASIVLEAGESRSVALTAQVPANASPGAHFGGVFFEYKTQPESTTGSAISVEVGDVISLQIAGTIVEDSRLREFSTDRILYGSPAVAFTTKVENLGNILVRPRGIIQITDMFGRQIASLPVNDALAPVFPGSVRAYVANWKDDGFAIGRYQAIVSLSYGSESKRTISQTTSFWVIPLKLTAAVLGTLLIIILGVYFWVQAYLRKQLNSMRGVSTETNSDDLGYYARKYNKTGSRILLIATVALLSSVILLAVLFILFA